MTVPFLDLSYQENVIRESRERRLKEIIERTAFVLGPHVAEFETAFAEYLDMPETVGVSGGTPALTMIFRALGIGEGDEVLMIPSTFIASATGVIYAGARPVFVDLDPKTRDFDYVQLEAAIMPHTKAILAVHLYGQPANMEKIMSIAERHGLLVVEDACQAHGALYKGQRVGTFGVASAFSFYPGKNLGAYGDGGAVATKDAELATVIRAMRNQGCVTKYDHEYLGYNGRLDALQAAVLSAKLPHLDEWNAMRSAVAHKYLEGLKGLPLNLPPVFTHTEPVWHLFVVEVLEGSREDFMEALLKDEVASGIHYPISLNKTKALATHGYGDQKFPESELLCSRVVSLPIYPGMSDEQVEYVISCVRGYFETT